MSARVAGRDRHTDMQNAQGMMIWDRETRRNEMGQEEDEPGRAGVSSE